MNKARRTALLLLAWAAAMPLLLLATISAWHWLAAAHFYAAPVLFVAHFLFALAGILFWLQRGHVGRWIAVIAAVLGVVVAAFAVIMIGGFGDDGPSGRLGTGGRLFLYALHGVYAAGHGLVALSAFRAARQPG